jgi:chromosome segregation ATPase
MVKKLQIKNREQNNADTIDIHGRIESLDQNLRSVDHRLRAVEKRLSIRTPQPDGYPVPTEDGTDVSSEIEELRKSLEILNKSVDEIKTEGEKLKETGLKSLETNISDAGDRITRLENQNKITIGKIKVPIEFSGILAAIVLLVTGYLISTDNWDIVRSSYYPAGIGVLFGSVVMIKFIMTNRK